MAVIAKSVRLLSEAIIGKLKNHPQSIIWQRNVTPFEQSDADSLAVPFNNGLKAVVDTNYDLH